MSHPSWVCGLKLDRSQPPVSSCPSHPSWVCGLKQLSGYEHDPYCCHTLRGCVD